MISCNLKYKEKPKTILKMLPIYNLILCIQSSTVTSSTVDTDPIEPVTLPKMVTFLNQIRIEKKLDDEQNAIYDALIEKYNLWDDCLTNIKQKLLEIHEFIIGNYQRCVSEPSVITLSEATIFSNTCDKAFADIAVLEKQSFEIACKLKKIYLSPKAYSILNNEENESMLVLLKDGYEKINDLKNKCSIAYKQTWGFYRIYNCSERIYSGSNT